MQKRAGAASRAPLLTRRSRAGSTSVRRDLAPRKIKRSVSTKFHNVETCVASAAPQSSGRPRTSTSIQSATVFTAIPVAPTAPKPTIRPTRSVCRPSTVAARRPSRRRANSAPSRSEALLSPLCRSPKEKGTSLTRIRGERARTSMQDLEAVGSQAVEVDALRAATAKCRSSGRCTSASGAGKEAFVSGRARSRDGVRRVGAAEARSRRPRRGTGWPRRRRWVRRTRRGPARARARAGVAGRRP